MKASYYNMFFPFDGKYILFNTLEGSILVVDSEVMSLLKKNEISSLDEECISVFTENGIIVEDKLDEQDAYRLVFERSKYTTFLVDVDIVTTYECNLSCIYCYEGKGELEHKRMDEKGAKCAIQFIENLIKNNGSRALRVDLFGGEPLLNMPVNLIIARELSKWCKENDKNFLVNALTNGTLSDEKIIEDLAQYNCNFMVVMDGPKEIHDKRRIYKNKKGTFEDIVDGLHRVIDNGLGAHLRINVDETNKDHIVPFLEFLKEEGLSKATITIKSVFNTSPACSSYNYCMPDIEGLIVVNRLYSIARSMNFITGESEEPPSPGACSAQKFSNFVIDPYLRLFKCNILLPFEKNAVGIINPENSEPVFNHLNVDFMSRDPLAADECRKCKLLPLCRGGCNVEIFETQGTTHGHICRKQGTYEVLRENLTTFVGKRKQ